ncbi:MAG: O-antigen ligase family protein [Muribaculaceae bacterium]
MLSKKIRYTILIIIVIILGTSQLQDMQFIIPIAVVLFAFLICTQSVIEDFYCFVCLIPYLSIFSINDIGVTFLFFLISSIKLLISNSEKIKDQHIIVALIIILIIESSNDLLKCSFGETLSPISYILYFSFFILFAPLKKINSSKLIAFFVIGLITVQIFSIIQAGGLTGLISNLDNTDIKIRLGETDTEKNYGNNLGGAMGFPIYSIMLICIAYKFIITNKDKIYRILIISFIIFEIIITLFTLSRVFFLGLSMFFICVIISVIQSKKGVLMLLFFIMIVAITYFYVDNSANILLEKYQKRGNDDISTGRFQIYYDSLEYLLNNFRAIFIGDGIIGYRRVGELLSKLFSMSAHNLYLDIIMSVGIIGFICLFSILKSLFKKAKEQIKGKATIITAMPFICYVIMENAGGSINDAKQYIYFLVLTIYIYSHKEHIYAKH